MAISETRKALTDGSESTAAAPLWILRHHAPRAIHFIGLMKDVTSSEVLLAAGDSEGRVSLTSLNDYRPRYFWKAHKESILGLDLLRIDEDNVILSSGRDNRCQGFSLPVSQDFTSAVLPSRIQAELPIPETTFCLDINALNYCPFSAIQADKHHAGQGVILAVTHTVDSGYIDLYHLPSKRRMMTAIGKADLATAGVNASRAAIVMSMQVIETNDVGSHRIIAGYEDGFVKCWEIRREAFSLQWSQRSHTESIMSIAVSKDRAFCVSVAADRQVVKYDMVDGTIEKITRSNSCGHACVAIREDNELIATGGWDGCIRLYNADLEHEGSLRYHKDTVQALSFIQQRAFADLVTNSYDSDDSEDEILANQARAIKAFKSTSILASGGKEGRICLWKT